MLNISHHQQILTVSVNRPKVHNALNDELIQELFTIITSIPKDTRAILLRSEGVSFSAGGDLEWMKKSSQYTFEENKNDALQLAKLFQAMVECPLPIIARIQGPTFGGGCGLVAASDIAIASQEAKFAFSEVKLGLIPATISSIVIPKIGAGNARALFTTGEVFDAHYAFHIGLVHAVVEPSKLDEIIDQKIKSILAAAPQAIARAKRLAQEPGLSPEEAATLLAEVRSSPEGREGIAAFLEKRRAGFNDS